MQDGGGPAQGPTRGRKRSVWERESENDSNGNNHEIDTNIYTADDLEETSPAKRLQNSQGEAITIPPPRRPLKFNAQRLLNTLAFTRLSLTANFSKFNPASSFIILCMVSEQNELYHALWYVERASFPVAQGLGLTMLQMVARYCQSCIRCRQRSKH